MKRRFTKLIILIALILIFRSVIFPPISWKTDEFCYLTIARQMNNGGTLYSDCADIKPVGIFYIYALADKIAGGNLERDFLVLKIFTIISVLLTSLMLWHIGGYYAALLFAVYSTCIRGSECLPANTELFAVLFLAASICFFCNHLCNSFCVSCSRKINNCYFDSINFILFFSRLLRIQYIRR